MTREKVAASAWELASNVLLVAVYAAVPFALLAAGNRSEVAPGEIVRPYLVVVVPAIAVIVLVAWRGGSYALSRAGAPLAVAILFTFDYHEIRPALDAVAFGWVPGMIVLWALGLAALVYATHRLAALTRDTAPALLLAGIVMLAPPTTTFADFSLSTTGGGDYGWERPLTLGQSPAPDVFFLLLDAYGRPDKLREQFGFDDGGFVAALHARGFVTPTHSRPAYAFTALSLPSILQMDYVAKPPHAANLTAAGSVLAGRNRVVSAFRSLGYAFAYAPSEYGGWGCRGFEDICVRPSSESAAKLGVSEFDWAALERTPLGDALSSVLPATPADALAHQRQFASRAAAAMLARTPNKPIFAFAHVLLSHPLYLYHGPGCAFRYDTANTGTAGARSYISALRCVNADTRVAVDEIIRKRPGAVIVIASDHGADVDVNHYTPEWRWTRALQKRRFTNFVAMRLPQRCDGTVPDDLIEVNIFRVVLNCLTDANLPLLPPQQYLVDQPTGAIRRPPYVVAR